MIRFVLFALITLTFFTVRLLPAGEFPSKPLADIIIIGNEHTDEDVIRRELLFSKGDILTDSLIDASRARLENLWLFNRVEFFPIPGNDSVSLLISVTERLYIFPYPEFKIEDRNWKKVTYGFGLAHDNFRGRNEKLYLSVLFGERPGYSFTYYNPWLNDRWHLVAGVYLKKYSKTNQSTIPVDDFDENHFYSAVTFGKYWTRDFHSRISLYRDAISVGVVYKSLMMTGSRTDINYGWMLSTAYDSRDIYAYPSNGWYIFLRAKQNAILHAGHSYFQYIVDIRRYIPWKNNIIALRTYTQQSIGTLPVYDRVYFGYNERVRGYFNEIIEGKHSFLNSIAFRFPILKMKYYTFKTDLLPAYYTRNLKFGINGGLFIDSGVVWERRNEFALNRFINGFGGGIHFLVPYLEVVRFDIGFNKKLQHEFIFEIEMAF